MVKNDYFSLPLSFTVTLNPLMTNLILELRLRKFFMSHNLTQNAEIAH